jgi:glycine oxidase
MHSADAVVIGGGIMGCAVGLRLAQAGLKPLVLERSIPGAEASSAAAGILSAQLHQRPGPLFEHGLASREAYADFCAEIEALSGVEVGYVRCGLISLGETLAPYRWQLRRGLRVEALDRAALHHLEPALVPRHRRGLLFCDEAQVDSPRLAKALSLAAARAGCAFRSDVRVVRITRRGGRVTGVELADGRVSSRVVVLAAGAWSSQVEGSGLRKDAVRPARGQIAQLETRPPLLSHVVFTVRGYAVPRPDGRLLIGSTVEMAGFEKRVTAGGLLGLLALGLSIAPALASAAVTSSWAGFRPYTDDELPILGASHVRGLYLCTGHFRSGIVLAPASAAALRDCIVDGRTAPELAAFRPSRAR